MPIATLYCRPQKPSNAVVETWKSAQPKGDADEIAQPLAEAAEIMLHYDSEADDSLTCQLEISIRGAEDPREEREIKMAVSVGCEMTLEDLRDLKRGIGFVIRTMESDGA